MIMLVGGRPADPDNGKGTNMAMARLAVSLPCNAAEGG